ncbi:MAG: MBL fold metallo-hydrolase [Bacteroidales bacterium]|nr:MBL fold metallo-hydrolase [Bacteroidales bacterium]
MKITFLVDNKTETTECKAEWGLSVLIEANGETILMDLGETGMFAENARKLGIDLNKVDFATISHGHSDHSGGAPAFFEVNDHAPVYVHRDAFWESVTMKHPKVDAEGHVTEGEVFETGIGIPWTEEFKKLNAHRFILTEGTYRIDEHTWLLGNVPRIEGFSPTEKFYVYIKDDKYTGWAEDMMQHEQTLVVEEEGRLHIFSGCSHNGIVPILKHITEKFPGKRISMIVAGMHLYSASPELRQKVVTEVANYHPDLICPVHCTGMNAIVDFKQAFGDKCRIAYAGAVYQV